MILTDFCFSSPKFPFAILIFKILLTLSFLKAIFRKYEVYIPNYLGFIDYLELIQVKLMTYANCNRYYHTKGTIYPAPPLGQDMTQGQFLSGV